MLTSPVALPGSDPIREVGAMLRPVGAIAGATVIVACWVTPPAVTVIVAGVACVTVDVVTCTGIDHVPAGMVTDAGTLAAGELLEKFTTSPPAGAGPWRFTKTSVEKPPATAAGESWTDCTASGSTVILSETVTPLIVAVIVTGVGTETCPIVTGKLVVASLPGTVTEAGTEAAAGFELVSATVAPAAPTPAVSWSASKKLLPLYTACGGSTPSSASETGVGGAALTVNVPVADGAVTAGRASTSGVEAVRSPWVEKMRQYLVPGVRSVTGTEGKCCWTIRSSMVLNCGSSAIWIV